MITFLRHLTAWSGLVAGLFIAATGVGAPPRSDAQRLKNEAERQAKDRLWRAEQQRKDEQNKREWQERQQRDAQQRAQREAQERARQQAAQAKAAAATFNAANAPPPDDCLKYFIIAAKSATTMEQLLAYLPDSEQKTLRERQASFDSQNSPQPGDSDRQGGSNPADEQPTSAGASPYEAALQTSKYFARQVVDILDVKVTGDQAVLTVATGYMVNGRLVPDGKASVEMVGEGSTWKVKTRGASPLVRKQSPTSP